MQEEFNSDKKEMPCLYQAIEGIVRDQFILVSTVSTNTLPLKPIFTNVF